MVTMSWWSDIWLNEGFAAFMEFVGGDHVHPEYLLWDTFYFETHRAMMRDASAETHQIVLKVEDPTDVRALFDGITYHKGAGVLHMLHEYLGGDVFFEKIRNYLKKYKFSNANTEQLFDELGGRKIIDMMNSWVRQPGTPLLKVECNIDENNNDKLRFVLTQERIRPKLGNADAVTPRIGKEQTWQIPIKIKDAQHTLNDLDLMKDKSVEFELDRVKSNNDNEYYMINPSMRSFMFTYYDTLSLNMLIKSFNELDKIDQFLVIADRFSLMTFNFIAADEYIEFLNKIIKIVDIANNDNINSLFWRMVIDSFTFIDDIFCELFQSRNRELRKLRLQFRKFGRDVLRPVWDKIGGFGQGNNQNEDNTDIVILRPLLLSSLVRLNDKEIIDGGFQILDECLEKNGNKFKLDSDGYIDCFDIIDQNIFEQLMEAGMAKNDGNGDDELIFDELINIYVDANNEIQSMILGSIGAVYQNSELLEAGVDFVLSHSVRLNVKGHGMASLRRCYGREQVWNDLLRRSHGAPRQVGMASTFAKQSIYNLVYSYYFGNHNGMVLRLPESKERIIKSVLEKVALNIKFLKSNKFKMMKWINNYIEEKKEASALIEQYNNNNNEMDDDKLLNRKQERRQRRHNRHKRQINGVTSKTTTLSPQQSLMLMITLFFVIISSCLIALWLYSVHKNTLII